MFEGEPEANDLGYCEILIGKMSRIIFTLQKNDHIYKKFSFTFPYIIEEQKDRDKLTKWLIRNHNETEIDGQLISLLTNLANENWFDDNIDTSNEALVFYEQILSAINDLGLELDTDNMVWHVVRKLFLFEPGYLRYDYDNSFRMNPISHPLHHLDIFFSNHATFKVGIKSGMVERKEWEPTEFVNLLDSEAPCFYLLNEILDV
ncbi:hypothetical protein VBD025_00790 [Virgibacillus flavescens]|uniref:hypothetical protein n=1 Tax=Virgibacillus flavescens TaxID=1611422 RepID=UPI003D35199F